MFFNFHCRYWHFYITQAVSILPKRQNKHSWAILPLAKHFQTTAERHYTEYFSSGHINQENNFTSYNYFMRQNIHSCFALWGKIYIAGAIFLPVEHDWLNWSHDSLDSLTVSVDCDIRTWVSLIDRWCYAFSAGKILAASSLHCVNCRRTVNLNPCFFTYCTCHMTISTSCVWLKVKCALKEWSNPLCLLQSIAISRTHSSLTLNQKMHKQQTCVAYK